MSLSIGLILTLLMSKEASPNSLLGSLDISTSNAFDPRDSNYNYNVEQYLTPVESTKKGPVVFPNDGPRPPKPPLIVTSRPLIESIKRSELNPDPDTNSSIPSSSELNHVSYPPDPDYLRDYDSKTDYSRLQSRLEPDAEGVKPYFRLKPGYSKPVILGRTQEYKPFVYPVVSNGFPSLHGVTSGAREVGLRDYEDHSALPPIYKAIADNAKLKAQKLQQKLKAYQAPDLIPHHVDYQVNKPEFGHHRKPHDRHLQQKSPPHHRYDDLEDDYPPNYAFSYKVRDRATGDDFSHSQHSSGSATNGEYRVRLPDGRMQIVSYTADENGYKADVRYDDEDKMKGNTLETHDDYKFGGGEHNHNDYDHNVYNDKYKINDRDYAHDDHKQYNHKETGHGHRPLGTDYKSYDPGNNLIYSDYFGNSDYKENNQDNIQNRDYKPIIVTENYKPVKEESKEDYNQYADSAENHNNHDYSLEYNDNDHSYKPHESKFSSFTPTPRSEVLPTAVSSTAVIPSYEELKNLFVTNHKLPAPTTPSSLDQDSTTERVVIIGNKPLYNNNLRNSVTSTPDSLSYTTPDDLVTNLTPSSYLISTIANLKKGEKPILSRSFIDRVNRYLSF